MPASNGKQPPTWDHLKKQKQPSFKKIRVIMDAEADFELKDAEQTYGLAQLMYNQTEMPPESTLKHYEESKLRLEKAKAAAAKASIEFKFQSLGRKRFSQLLDEHAPTTLQIEKAERDGEEKPDWNYDTFPQALVQAACVSPTLTPEDVTEMWDGENWSGSELNDLFTAAVSCQNTRRLLEVGND